MARRRRLWIQVDQNTTLTGTQTKQLDLISSNLLTETGMTGGGGGQVTIERIIGSMFYRSDGAHNNIQQFESGIMVESEHIDSDDWPSISTSSARWMWQTIEVYTGLAHDSTAQADQRPLSRIPIDVAVMRKVQAHQKLFQFFQAVGNSHGTSIYLRLRVLLVLP